MTVPGSRVLGLLSLALVLGACRSVPDVTRVAVPSGATVFNGSYTGTLTEGLSPQDAVLNQAGTALYLVAGTSRHTTLLELDPETGREQRRAEVAVDSPAQMALRRDGVLVVAGWNGSGVVDPQTLRLTQSLPPAARVSQDGERLLVPDTIDTAAYVLLDSRTGREVSRTPRPSLSSEAFGRPSADLTWVASSGGSTLLNLRTGQRLDSSVGHPDPCGLIKTSSLQVRGVAGLSGGVALSFNDGTVEWRGADGTLLDTQNLGGGCAPDALLNAFDLKSVGQPLLFYTSSVQGLQAVGELRSGQAPTFAFKESKDDPARSGSTRWFGGTFAYGTSSRPLFAEPGTEPVLDNWQHWKQSYLPARFPVSADVRATFRDADVYDIAGSVNGPTGALTLSGTGSHTGQQKPGIVFTQALCSGDIFGPQCPTTDWQADLLSGTDKVGTADGSDLDPNVSSLSRRTQTGALSLQWNGETRSFTFELTPR